MIDFSLFELIVKTGSPCLSVRAGISGSSGSRLAKYGCLKYGRTKYYPKKDKEGEFPVICFLCLFEDTSDLVFMFIDHPPSNHWFVSRSADLSLHLPSIDNLNYLDGNDLLHRAHYFDAI